MNVYGVSYALVSMAAALPCQAVVVARSDVEALEAFKKKVWGAKMIEVTNLHLGEVIVARGEDEKPSQKPAPNNVITGWFRR